MMVMGTIWAGWWGWEFGPWAALLGGIVGGTLAKGAGYGDPGGFTGSVFVALLGSVLLRLALEFVDRRPRR